MEKLAPFEAFGAYLLNPDRKGQIFGGESVIYVEEVLRKADPTDNFQLSIIRRVIKRFGVLVALIPVQIALVLSMFLLGRVDLGLSGLLLVIASLDTLRMVNMMLNKRLGKIPTAHANYVLKMLLFFEILAIFVTWLNIITSIL